MSKQSNQRYRKDKEKELTKKDNTNNTTSDSIKNKSTQFNYGDGILDAPSTNSKK